MWEGQLPQEASLSELEERCKLQISSWEFEEATLEERIVHLRRMWTSRQRHLREELHEVQQQRERHEAELEDLKTPHEDPGPPPPGPVWLQWVDGTIFSIICNLVIITNLITITLELFVPSTVKDFFYPDQLFLVFYVTELTLKAFLHQRGLLLGQLRIVWWNWLDLLIVVTGVMDQWLQPLVMGIVGQEHHPSFHSGGFRVLRLLRLVRIIRVLKIVKIFLKTDLSWAEGGRFQSFITGVIAANGIILGLELDFHWGGWYWVEQAMLVIYFFELSVRLKRWMLRFFVHPDDWAWNNLDFMIVAGGVVEQWLMPLKRIIVQIITGEPPQTSASASLLPLLRMMRLLRILRLLRLLKSFKPLYKLALGIMEAMQAMQWVMVLTVILLYASAILFTSLVGHGLMPGNDVPDDARALFRSVGQAFFNLFRVMNGDLGPFEPLFPKAGGKILCIGFVIISNWAVLAILTAVVSENMISATEDHEMAEKKELEEATQTDSKERLTTLFKEIDKDGDGRLDEQEFADVVRDTGLCNELCSASQLNVRDLQDLFSYLSKRDHDGQWTINYKDFIDKLQVEGKDVSERSLFRLEKQMRILEQKIDNKLMLMQDKLHRHHNIDYIIDDTGRARAVYREEPFWRA